jgi:hypothetical protein
MGFIVIIPLAALAGWSIFRIHRWLRLGNFGSEWLRAFAILGCVGVGLGIWLTFFTDYRVANMRMGGFPIPLRIASRVKSEDPWVAAAMPGMIRCGAAIANLLSGVALSLVPLAVAAFFKENRRSQPLPGQPGV